MIYAPKFKCFWVLDCLNLSSKNFPLKGNKELLGFSKKNNLFIFICIHMNFYLHHTHA